MIVLPRISEGLPPARPTVTLLIAGLAGGSGSTVGPGGALFVAGPFAGRVSRVDPETGEVETFASGLPAAIVGVGGPMDIAFIGSTAYVLVTQVGSDVGGSDVVVYRVDGPSSFTVVADLGAFSLAHPPATPFFVPTGVQYAIEAYRGGFLVTDGHHNRNAPRDAGRNGPRTDHVWQYRADRYSRGGQHDLHGASRPDSTPAAGWQGSVFRPRSPSPALVGSGASLLVDAEFGRGRRLYALSQGPGVPGAPDGSPAQPAAA